MSNMDIALTTLASEINALETARASDNKSKQVAMGHKLIVIRELLRQKNGAHISGHYDCTGNRAPIGWGQWVTDNLTITLDHAATCIKIAADPDGLAKKAAKQTRYGYRAVTILRGINRGWPTWTKEQRDEFCAGVLKLMETA